jgi:hypothetical protein
MANQCTIQLTDKFIAYIRMKTIKKTPFLKRGQKHIPRVNDYFMTDIYQCLITLYDAVI